MITSLRLENFRSHEVSDLGLQPLSVLVGPAGAGKSNVLKAFLFLRSTLHNTPAELFPPGPFEFRWVRSRWANETASIGMMVGLKIADQEAKYTLRFADSPQGVYVLEETLQRLEDPGGWQWIFQRRWKGRPELGEFGRFTPYDETVLNRAWRAKGAISPGLEYAQRVARLLSKSAYYHLEAGNLKTPGEQEGARRIGYNGDGLPEYLGEVKETNPTLFNQIVEEMRELLPALDTILINPAGIGKQGIAFRFRDYSGYINAPDLSDGTLFTLGMLAVVHSKDKAHLLCIEEPETGLHPRRLRWLFDKFVTLAYPSDGGLPGTQIILTTHSPYLLDLFRDMQSSVLIVEHEMGRSRISSLPDIKSRLREPASDDPIGREWATGLFEGL